MLSRPTSTLLLRLLALSSVAGCSSSSTTLGTTGTSSPEGGGGTGAGGSMANAGGAPGAGGAAGAATSAGGSLAAMAGGAGGDLSVGTGGATAGRTAAGGASAAGGSDGVGGALQPVPTATYPACTGMPNTLAGVCCTYLECYTPPAGTACAPAPAATTAIADWPPLCHGVGSGSCDCGVIEGPFAGPYGDPSAFTSANHPTHCMGPVGSPSPFQDGACCYTVPVTSCEGRPLFIEDAQRVARLAARSDWGRA